jgi:transcriptional regulator
VGEPIDVVPGTLEMLLLKTLSPGRAMHGFEMLRWIRDTTEGELSIEEGALYPALHRMERRGWLQAEWGVSEKGRRAKYYEITGEGRRELDREEARWRRYMAAWDRIAVAVTA